MKIFYADHYVLPLPEQHRFPMRKYAPLRARVEEEGLAGIDALQSAPGATDDRLVFDLCKSAGVAVAIAMEGGYARRIEDSVDIHLATVRAAAELLTST